MSKRKKKKAPIHLAEIQFTDVNFAYQKVVSFSQYSTWLQCPHKWYLQTVKRLKEPPNINFIFGTAIHTTLQHYITMMYKESGAAADRENLEELFENVYKGEYRKEYTKFKYHFSTKEELAEYYEDGLEIIKWFKSHRNIYFKTKGNYLIGVEKPLQIEIKKNVIFSGKIDLVIYDSVLDKLYIYDFKTSTKGWNDWNKKDDKKTSQLLLYKQYFAEIYQFPVEKIEVEFIILKRKAEPNEFQEFPKRIQIFRPVAGKIKLKETKSSFQAFLNECFDENGKFIDKEYRKGISKLCDYCMFNNTPNCIK